MGRTAAGTSAIEVTGYFLDTCTYTCSGARDGWTPSGVLAGLVSTLLRGYIVQAGNNNKRRATMMLKGGPLLRRNTLGRAVLEISSVYVAAEERAGGSANGCRQPCRSRSKVPPFRQLRY